MVREGSGIFPGEGLTELKGRPGVIGKKKKKKSRRINPVSLILTSSTYLRAKALRVTQ